MPYQIVTNLKIYLLVWLSAVAVSILILFLNRKTCSFLKRSYWSFLFEPWKVFTFAVATLMITLAAPYSGDPTWDIPDSIMISISVYVLAPWSMAILYRSIRLKQWSAMTFVALCFFFIPCWIYDLYILLRDKIYPPTWDSNLYLSGGIVFIAGLFWNLLWREEHGLTFAFTTDKWPPQERTPFKKVFWPCFLLAIPVVASVGWFVYMYFMK